MLLIRRIRELLYEQGFTISGARNRLDESRGHVDDTPQVALISIEEPELQAIRTELADIVSLLQSARETSLAR